MMNFLALQSDVLLWSMRAHNVPIRRVVEGSEDFLSLKVEPWELFHKRRVTNLVSVHHTPCFTLCHSRTPLHWREDPAPI